MNRKKRYNTLIFLGLFFIELSLFFLIKYNFIFVGIAILIIGFIIYIFWLVRGQIAEYKDSPYKHIKQFFLLRRSFRIKFLSTIIICLVILLHFQLFGFSDAPFSNKSSVSLLQIIVIIGLSGFLLRDILINRKL
jgi:uncharacterized protein YpmB